MQVIVGIVNPSSPINFTIQAYEYWFSSTNYGLSLKGEGTYEPSPLSGVTLMKRGQLKLYPFFTKLYSDVSSPIRMAFKVSAVPSSLPTLLSFNAGDYLLLIDNVNLPGFSKFECLIRGWSK